MYKISIIVTVYNTEKYLKRCLDSLVNQTYKDIEIIIINDGSTDNSQEVIDYYKGKHPNQIKTYMELNKGVAYARNYGVKKISGDYFLFVDSDDYIENYLCENLIKELKNKKVDIIKYKMQIKRNDKNIEIDGPVFNKKNGEEAFNILCFKDSMIDTPCLYLFNTDFYKKNDFKFTVNTYHEDFGLIPLVLLKANTMTSIDFYGYNYTQESNSITRNEDYTKTVKKANDLLVHYDNMIKEINNIDLNKQTTKNIKQYYSNAIFNVIKKLKNKDQSEYKKRIRERKLVNNLQVKNLKQLAKKFIIILKIYYN